MSQWVSLSLPPSLSDPVPVSAESDCSTEDRHSDGKRTERVRLKSDIPKMIGQETKGVEREGVSGGSRSRW